MLTLGSPWQTKERHAQRVSDGADWSIRRAVREPLMNRVAREIGGETTDAKQLTMRLHHHDVHHLVAVKGMPPAASPFVHVARFAHSGSSQTTDVVQDEPARDEKLGLIGVSALAEGVLTAEDAVVDDLIGEASDKVGM